MKPYILPEYERAYVQFLETVISGFIDEDQILGRTSRYSSNRQITSRNVISEKALDFEGVETSASALFEFEHIRAFNIDEHSQQVAELATSKMNSLKQLMFEQLNDVCDATGNTVDGAGQKISHDTIIDLLEKIDWEFDENGEPIKDNLIFVLPPDMIEQLKMLEETEQHHERMKHLTDRKRQEWLAKRRTRILNISKS
jgi:hypothetical protein